MALISGPFFSPSADAFADRQVEGQAEAMARRGVDLVRYRLGQVLKRPTGYYSSRVVADLAGPDNLVHDSDVVYGPWLEGVSSRNQTTRFKGYSTFRRAAQELGQQAPRAAAEAAQDIVRGLS